VVSTAAPGAAGIAAGEENANFAAGEEKGIFPFGDENATWLDCTEHVFLLAGEEKATLPLAAANAGSSCRMYSSP
jgi:hypothetical protein